MRILSIKELMHIVPLSRTTIWRHERQGKFPNRRRLGNRIGWVEDEVRAWLMDLPRGMALPTD